MRILLIVLSLIAVTSCTMPVQPSQSPQAVNDRDKGGGGNGGGGGGY